MFREAIWSRGLSHISYVIGDAGVAAVIDPHRDSDDYIAAAHRLGARITHIIETHRHEDFVVGSIELARRTGATIYHGRGQPFAYGMKLNDGDELRLGALALTVLETPGHTPESISLAIADTTYGDTAVAVLTGDTLFIGSVGRTDLVAPGRERDAAGKLYESIVTKILPLGDQAIVLPAHGAGSVCGAGMAERSFSTIGYERLHNPALAVSGPGEFIERRLATVHERPPYFSVMEEYNLHGPPPLATLPAAPPLTVDELAARMHSGLQLIDVRNPEAYLGASIPGSLALPLDLLSSFAGWFLDYKQEIGIVADTRDQVDAAVLYLVRLGYDRVVGALGGGMHAWVTSGRRFQTLRAAHAGEIERRVSARQPVVMLDVRSRAEVDALPVAHAQHVYVGEIPQRYPTIPKDRPIVVFCSTGQRATIAASLLGRYGFDRVDVWMGSVTAARATGSSLVPNRS